MKGRLYSIIRYLNSTELYENTEIKDLSFTIPLLIPDAVLNEALVLDGFLPSPMSCQKRSSIGAWYDGLRADGITAIQGTVADDGGIIILGTKQKLVVE